MSLNTLEHKIQQININRKATLEIQTFCLPYRIAVSIFIVLLHLFLDILHVTFPFFIQRFHIFLTKVYSESYQREKDIVTK